MDWDDGSTPQGEWRGIVGLLLALITVLVLCLAGCGSDAAARAAWARDKSHHCRVAGRREHGTANGWDYRKSRPDWTTEGITIYSCDQGVYFHIMDDEAQP